MQRYFFFPSYHLPGPSIRSPKPTPAVIIDKLFVFFRLNMVAMRYLFLFISFLVSAGLRAQTSRDTVLSRCPVFITDTVSMNNYFLEARPATMKVYRVRGDLTVVVEQKDQMFSLFFHEKRLRSTTYDIEPGSKGRGEVESTYSFRSGDQVAYIVLSKGTVQSSYDKVKKLWTLKVNGLLSNMSERNVSYYRVKAELVLK